MAIFLTIVSFIGLIIIVGVFWMYYLHHLKKNVNKFIDFFVFFIFILILFAIVEILLIQHFSGTSLIYIFYLEMIGILIYGFLIYAFRIEISQSENSVIVYFSILVLIFQLFIIAIFGIVLTGFLLIGLILPLVIYMYRTSDIDNIKMALSFVIPIYLGLAYMAGEFIIAGMLLLFIAPIALFCSEFMRRRIMHTYYTLRIKLRRHFMKKTISIDYRKKRKIRFYQARISINKLAYVEELDPRLPLQRKEQTWFQRFFDDIPIYGIEMICRNSFTFTFLIKTRTKDEADDYGRALLQRLTSMYRGADGKAKVKEITNEDLFTVDQDKFIEIKPPSDPFVENFTLLKDFCNLYGRTGHEIRLYIIWKKAKDSYVSLMRDEVEMMEYKDEQEKYSYYQMWQGDLFQAKFIISYKINEVDNVKKSYEERALEGMIKGLGISSRSAKESAQQKDRWIGCWTDILTGNFYNGRLITPKCLDFDFTIDLPIEKKFTLEKQSKKPLDLSRLKKDDIMIGHYIEDGVLRETRAHLSIDDFAKSMIFIGDSGKGKTVYMSFLMNQIKEKTDIGVLYINLEKESQEGLYPVDIVLKYGELELEIPYYLLGYDSGKYIEQESEILIGAIGLKNVVVENMMNTIKMFVGYDIPPPKSVQGLFLSLLKYFKKFPYHGRFQQNITNAIRNRVNELFSDNVLNRTLEPIKKAPKWFMEWRKGKHILIDLSMCKEREKRLLMMLILQIIRTLTPHKESEKLQGIINIDEAHAIAEKPEGQNVDDDVFIAKEALRKILEPMVVTFRSRGISLGFADQSAFKLFDKVARKPSLKFLFGQDLSSAEVYTKEPKELQLLTRLAEREVLVINGVKGHLFTIRTPDFIIPKKKLKEEKKPINFEIKKKKVCGNCWVSLDDDAEYCFSCGTLVP